MPIYTYLKRVTELAISNDFETTKISLIITATAQFISTIFSINFFGVSNFVLLLVMLTVLIDAHFGIKKSLFESEKFLNESKKHGLESMQRKRLLRKSEIRKFQPKKLQYTFFKCITLLGYLFFVKNIMELEDGEGTLAEIIGFASGVVIKAPIAIFWYYDFKSIGENTTVVYGKKAPIFRIVEKMFEPRLKVFFEDKKEEL